MANISIKYGNYSFKPVPQIEFSNEVVRSDAGYAIGSVDKISLKGILFGSGEINDAGVTKKDNSFNNLMTAITGLKSALEQDYLPLDIACSGAVIYKSDPNVTFVDSIDFTNSDDEYWLQIANYSISFSVYKSGTSSDPLISYVSDQGYLVSEFIDNYSIKTNDESYYKFIDSHIPKLGSTFGLDLPSYTVTRNLSANGIETKNTSALENAKKFVSGLAASTNHGLNVMMSGLFVYDRSTVINQDPINGTYSINDTFMAYSGSSGWADTYTLTATTSLDANFTRTVELAGEVKGLTKFTADNETLYSKMTDNTFSTDLTEKGYARQAWVLASGGFYNFVHPNVLNKINNAFSSNTTGIFNDLSSLTGCVTTLIMNPVPLSVSIQHNIPQGSISYSYSYDNRPIQAVTGALDENLEVTDSFSLRSYAFPDIFYKMPIAQDLGTYSMSTRSVSYTATMPKDTGCPPKDPFDLKQTSSSQRDTQVKALISKFNPSGLTPLTANRIRGPKFYSYIKENRESIDVTTGKYSYNVTWEYQKLFVPSTFPTFRP